LKSFRLVERHTPPILWVQVPVPALAGAHGVESQRADVYFYFYFVDQSVRPHHVKKKERVARTIRSNSHLDYTIAKKDVSLVGAFLANFRYHLS
jgi:hypothetical protein